MKKRILVLSLATVLPFSMAVYATTSSKSSAAKPMTQMASPKKEKFNFVLMANSAMVSQVGENKYQILLSDLSKQGVIGADEHSDKQLDDTYNQFNDVWHAGGAKSFAEIPPMGTLTIGENHIPPAKFTDFYFNAKTDTVLIDFSFVENVGTGKLSSLPTTVTPGKVYHDDVKVFVDDDSNWW